MLLEYIKLMDCDFTNVRILNCESKEELFYKIEENQIIEVIESGKVYYINPSYIMYFR